MLQTMLDADETMWPETRRRQVAADRLSAYLDSISEHTRRTLPGRTMWTEALVRAFAKVKLGIDLPECKLQGAALPKDKIRKRRLNERDFSRKRNGSTPASSSVSSWRSKGSHGSSISGKSGLSRRSNHRLGSASSVRSFQGWKGRIRGLSFLCFTRR